MARARKIAALVEEFGAGSAAQHLVDRLLLGFPRGGELQRVAGRTVTLHAAAAAAANQAEIARRTAGYGLKPAATVEEAVRDAEAVLIVPPGAGDRPPGNLLHGGLSAAPSGSAVFVHGVTGTDAAAARKAADLAASRKLRLASGSYLPFTWRLPAVDTEWQAEISEGLLVTVGPPGEAEFLGLEGILPLLERRRGGESGARRVQAIVGPAIWRAGERGLWPLSLLGPALSRSDTPQGDALLDGRTQDLVGLGLVPALARDPLAYLVEERDGLRWTLLVLNGVVGDLNFAIARAGGATLSAQLYRPPPPSSHHWSCLLGRLEEFFGGAAPPSPPERAILLSGLLQAFRRARAAPGEWIETPELALAYSAPRESSFERD
jgi:hypothetical protein